MLYLSETTEQSPTDAKLTKKKKNKKFYRCLRFGILAITVLKRAKKKKNKQTNKQTLKQKRPHDFRESAIDDYRENAIERLTNEHLATHVRELIMNCRPAFVSLNQKCH